MQLHSHLKERGEQLKLKLPKHYCPNCTALVLDDEVDCADCQAAKPTSGWPHIDQQAYPLLGRVLQDRYLVTGFVASGAHAQVYRVWSLHISRTFAIKIIDLDEFHRHEQQELVVRMQREIDALARLHNPHIVALHDILELGPKAVGLVMEFIDGWTLSTLIEREGKIAWPRAIRLIRQLALAIQSLHELGVIHRDIKPENVMVSKLAAQMEFVRLLDFGLVSGKNRVTSDFIGTPLHASPEICAGGLDVDFRSDIYSLGSVLFTMIAGRAPVDGGSIFEIIYKKVSSDAPALATTVELPPAVDAFVTRLLSRDKDKRPASVEGFITEIDTLLDSMAAPRYTSQPMPAVITPSPMAPVQRQVKELRSVIVADDDLEALRCVQATLTPHKIACVGATSADELLDICVKQEPQLIFLSTALPQATENHLVKLLKQRTSARLIIMAPNNSPADVLDAFELAGVDFLLKPLQPSLILDRLGLSV